MANINQLYQELIVRHSQHPANYGDISGCTHRAEKNNPLCGDDLELKLRVDGEMIVDAAFQGSACAICIASASMMTSVIEGLQIDDAMKLGERFGNLFEDDVRQSAAKWLNENLPDFLAFEGIREFPVRIQCARLPWEAFKSAVNEEATNE